MILNVENLTHGFGDRAIFYNVSFLLLADIAVQFLILHMIDDIYDII